MNANIKKSTFALAALLVALIALASPAAAQVATTQTTISTAQGKSDNTITLTSGTGVTAWNGNQVITGIFLDSEYEEVTTLVSGTTYNVHRGRQGTRQQPHASGALVWIGPPSYFDNGPYDLAGSCTANQMTNTPRPNLRTGDLQRCVGGVYVAGNMELQVGQGHAGNSYTIFTTPAVPNAIAVNSTTGVAGKIWAGQLFIPVNATLTGACLLNGATVGTDKQIYALYDATGALLANTAVAGTTTATASKYQCLAFTATVQVAGPQTYYIAAQSNGTTDNFATYATAAAPTNYGTTVQTGVFGTLAAITPSTTFTAAQGPIMMVY
jgi:hypothetical protein